MPFQILWFFPRGRMGIGDWNYMCHWSWTLASCFCFRSKNVTWCFILCYAMSRKRWRGGETLFMWPLSWTWASCFRLGTFRSEVSYIFWFSFVLKKVQNIHFFTLGSSSKVSDVLLETCFLCTNGRERFGPT